MNKELIDKINLLENSKETFALAQIIRRVNPSSGKPGDKAIITKDGHIYGWIGGGCTKGIVLKESLLAIKDRKSRFITIRPGKFENALNYTKSYVMTCQSGGEVDVFIEPMIPNPTVTIFGASHIARALAKLSMAMGYRTEIVYSESLPIMEEKVDKTISMQDVPSEDFSNNYLVVCTQGYNDENALELAIKSNPKYCAFVASRKKAASIYGELRSRGVTMDKLKEVFSPAGLDINAKTPEEVAISILGEIIKTFRAEETTDADDISGITLGEDYYLNPVCKVPIQKSTAKHVLNYKDEKVYFCCDGCKVSFEKSPAAYMEA